MDDDLVFVRLIDGRRMQCKDISDDAFLQAVRSVDSPPPSHWRMRWDVEAQLEKEIGPIPLKLLLTKANRLIERGLLGGCGCGCGCRGDWHPSDECIDKVYCCPERKADDSQ